MDCKSIAMAILLLFALEFHMGLSAEGTNQAMNQVEFYKGMPEIENATAEDKLEKSEQSSTIANENRYCTEEEIEMMVEEIDALISCFEDVEKQGGEIFEEEVRRALEWLDDVMTDGANKDEIEEKMKELEDFCKVIMKAYEHVICDP